MVWDRPSRWDESTDPKPEDRCISPEECEAHQACALTSKGGCGGRIDELDGMTDAKHSAALSSRIPSLESTQHISDKADELIAKYDTNGERRLKDLADGDDAGFFLSSLTPSERDSVKADTIRRALEVGKQIGALEEREAIVKWLRTMQDERRPLAPDLLADDLKEEKHHADRT